MNSTNPIKNYDYGTYFIDPASPFMRAIVDLHDYVFMFLVGILIFVTYIMYVTIRDNNIMSYEHKKLPMRYLRLAYNVAPFSPFYYYSITKFVIVFSFRKLFDTLVLNYYDLFIGSKIYYYYEFLLNEGNSKTFFKKLHISILRLHTQFRYQAELNSAAGGLKNRLTLDSSNSALYIFSELYNKFFTLPWILINKFGSSFSQFFIFQNFILNSNKLDLYYLTFLKVVYAEQLKASTINAYKFTHNDILETIWTVLPSIILVFIAIPSLLVLFALDEVGKPVLTVKAVGHQWYWSYEVTYTSQENETKTWNFDSYMIAAADLISGQHRNLEVDDTLYLPVNTHVRLLATSMDVIHSWAVPALGVKIDAVPGRLNQVGLFVDRFGTFYGQCSEICGTNHAFMPIRVHVFPVFDLWLSKFNHSVE